MAWMAVIAAIQAVGSILQGVQASNAAKQNALNAKLEGNQALATGEAGAQRARAIVASQQSQLKADVGASGTEFTGSPLEVYTKNALQGEIQAQDEIYKGKLVNYSKRMEADLYKRQASAAMVQGIFGAVGSAAKAYGASSGGSSD